MNIIEMTKQDFEAVQHLESLFLGELTFDSLVIIPTDDIHDSGFGCMDFVAVDKDGKPIVRFGGSSDVIHIDGVMGVGKHRYTEPYPEKVIPKRWSVDLLPCGYVRIFCSGCRLTTDGVFISDLELYAV